MEVTLRGIYLGRDGKTLLVRQIDDEGKPRRRELYCPDDVELPELRQDEDIYVVGLILQKRHPNGTDGCFKRCFMLVRHVESTVMA